MNPESFVLISDPAVAAIPAVECGEPLRDVDRYWAFATGAQHAQYAALPSRTVEG